MNDKHNTRSRKVYINSIITVTAQILQVLFGFAVRRVFISTLGVSYLGYNSVFTNLLQMLNLADMGIGVAITSYLYLPLAEGDNDKVASLIYLYRRIYSIIGMTVLVIGIVLSIFLPFIITDAQCSNAYLRLLFYINLAGSVSTYYLGYYRTLLIADQKSYITSLVDTTSYITVSIAQVVLLFFYSNYIVYLILAICKNVFSNIIIALYVHHNYVYLEKSYKAALVEEYKPHIITYVKDVFVSRIGATVFYSTDNIIISIFKGSLLTGYYSNYTLVIVQVQNLLVALLSSIQATFGNYLVTNIDPKARKKMTQNYYCANFIIGNIVLICCTCLLQPFIKLFFGNNMILSASTAMLLSINLMLTIMLQLPSQIFQIFKLFKYDKLIIAISASLNIIISIALVGRYGVDGCLVGTLITSLIYIFSRFYIIARKVFNDKFRSYIKVTLGYFLIAAISTCVVYESNLHFNDSSLIIFLLHALLVLVESVIITLLSVCYTKPFKLLCDIMLNERLKKLSHSLLVKFSGIVLLIALLTLSVFISIKGYAVSYSPAYGNKSVKRVDSYEVDNVVNLYDKIYHFSIDDTLDVFKDIKNSNYQSIFDNNTLRWLKYLHDNYGTCISLYVFYGDNDFNLSQFPNTYKHEFENNSDWLRFGFHAINANTIYDESSKRDLFNDYQLVTKELVRIVGDKSVDNVIRLASFKGKQSAISEISNSNEDQPVVGLLTADDKRDSYYLDNTNNEYIYCHDYMNLGDVTYISTDLRVEFIDNVNKKLEEISNCSAWNNQRNIMEVFTHEWELNYANKEKIEDICNWMNKQGYINGFMEDKIG